MCSCVLNQNITVLVNDCLTQDIITQRGLKLSGPLSPFLFLFMVEGQNGLFSKEEGLGIFLDLEWVPRILVSPISNMRMIQLFCQRAI